MKEKLGKFVAIRTGKLDANASSENGKYPFFTCSITPLKIDTYSYDCECVLVAGNGDLNVKYYKGKFDAYQRTYIIESSDKGILSVKYLYLFLEYYIEELRRLSVGGVIKYIRLSNLTDALINVPSWDIQKEITEKLEKLLNIISKRKEQLAKLDALAKSRFIEMFGEKKSSRQICDFVDRNISSAKKIYDDNSTIKYIDISSIDNKDFSIKFTAEYYFKDAPSRAQQCVKEGDILVSTVRPNLKNIAILNGDENNYVASSGFCILRSVKCPSEFLFGIIFSDDFTNKMISLTTGANYPAIKDSDILKYPVPDASLSEMTSFSAFIRQLDKSKFRAKKCLKLFTYMRHLRIIGI